MNGDGDLLKTAGTALRPCRERRARLRSTSSPVLTASFERRRRQLDNTEIEFLLPSLHVWYSRRERIPPFKLRACSLYIPLRLAPLASSQPFTSSLLITAWLSPYRRFVCSGPYVGGARIACDMAIDSLTCSSRGACPAPSGLWSCVLSCRECAARRAYVAVPAPGCVDVGRTDLMAGRRGVQRYSREAKLS